MESLFIQSIVKGDKNLPLQLLLEATYIESIRLNSPKLIITFADRDNDIVHTYGVTNGVELVVTMGDVYAGDGDSFTDSFIVISPPKKVGDTVLVEALQKDVYQLKQHLNTPIFFVDKSPTQILKRLVPSKELSVLGVNGRGTFHIHNSTTPSAILEQMGKELGAVVFYSRGIFHVISYSQIHRNAVSLEFEYNNPQAENIIYGITTPFSTNLIHRQNARNYQMWDENVGIIKGGDKSARQCIGNLGKDRLAKLNTSILPVMMAHTRGTTMLRPAVKLGFVLHRLNDEFIVNESIPDQQVVIEVKHYQKGYSYICQTTSGVLSE